MLLLNWSEFIHVNKRTLYSVRLLYIEMEGGCIAYNIDLSKIFMTHMYSVEKGGQSICEYDIWE